MALIKRLCLYCGASERTDEVYRAAAREVGRRVAEAGIELVYGGGRVGLMGLAANAALQTGGHVIGIIPGHLHDAEIGHHGVSELLVVDSMHERKQRMFELSDAFAVLPGGLGTLDETFEIITWRQLGLHDKPIVIIDVAGYWQPFQAMIDHIIAANFASAATRRLFRRVDRVEELLPALAASHEPGVAARTGLV